MIPTRYPTEHKPKLHLNFKSGKKETLNNIYFQTEVRHTLYHRFEFGIYGYGFIFFCISKFWPIRFIFPITIFLSSTAFIYCKLKNDFTSLVSGERVSEQKHFCVMYWHESSLSIRYDTILHNMQTWSAQQTRYPTEHAWPAQKMHKQQYFFHVIFAVECSEVKWREVCIRIWQMWMVRVKAIEAKMRNLFVSHSSFVLSVSFIWIDCWLSLQSVWYSFNSNAWSCLFTRNKNIVEFSISDDSKMSAYW